MGRFASRYISIKFIDATPSTPLDMVIGPGPGDFTISEFNSENTEMSRNLDRGTFEGHVETDDLEQTWSITLGMKSETFTEAAADRLEDWFNKTANFSAAISTHPDLDIWAWIVEITYTRNGVTGIRTLPVCQAKYSVNNAADGCTLTLSGTNNGPMVRS